MRRVMMAIGVLAVASAAVIARADTVPQAYCNLQDFQSWYDLSASINVGDNSLPPYYGPPPSLAAATTGGVLWIDAGSGPIPTQQDVNMEFLGSTTKNGAYVELVDEGGSRPAWTPALFLLSKPADDPQTAIGWNLTAMYGPPGDGNPNGMNGIQGIFMDPFADPWGIPGVDNDQTEYVKIRAWTGDYSTYAAAYAASASGTPGVYVGETAAFLTNFATSTDPNVGDLSPMPALVLRPVPAPEPSTLLLAAFGLLGLLAFAWGKRN